MKKRYILIFLISFVVFFVLMGGAYFLYKTKITETDFQKAITENPELKPEDPKDDTVVNALLMGVDEARSDIMILASYNKLNNKMTLVSIPRDTRVEIPGYGFDKINAASARKEGAALAMETVGHLFQLPIHYYVKIDFKGAERIIDILGGVKVNVPINMDYDDPAQDLHIHIKRGEQVLDGENAVKFVRFRSGYPDQDLGRIKAQQEFIKAFAAKLTSPSSIPKAFSLIDAMSKCIRTNMDQGDIAKYAMQVKDLKVDNIKLYTLPGKPGYAKGVAYYIHDQYELVNLMNQIKRDLEVEAASEPVSVASAEAGGTATDATTGSQGGSDTAEEAGFSPSDIKVQILNSSRKSGMASKLKQELEAKGYQVVKIGDTKDMVFNYTRMVDRCGNPDKVKLAAADLGIDIIDNDIDITCGYDITIIIGKDRINGGI